MKTITTIGQATEAKPGTYRVKGAVGVVFRKTVDSRGGGLQSAALGCGKRRWISGRPRPVHEAGRGVHEVEKGAQRPRRGRGSDRGPTRQKGARPQGARHLRETTQGFRQAYTPTLKGKYADRNWFAPLEIHVLPTIGDLLMNEIVGHGTSST